MGGLGSDLDARSRNVRIGVTLGFGTIEAIRPLPRAVHADGEVPRSAIDRDPAVGETRLHIAAVLVNEHAANLLDRRRPMAHCEAVAQREAVFEVGGQNLAERLKRTLGDMSTLAERGDDVLGGLVVHLVRDLLEV